MAYLHGETVLDSRRGLPANSYYQRMNASQHYCKESGAKHPNAIYVKHLEKAKTIQTGSRLVVLQDWGWKSD